MRLVRKLLPILVFLVPLAAAAFPQNGSVLEIAVTGNQRVSKEAILAAMRTKVGQTFSQTQLDQDKVAIEDLGFFEAVDVRAKTMEPAGWGITVDVREWPVIKEIRIVGNTVVKTAEIQKAITVQPGQVFNLKNVKPSVEAITSLYNKKGYFARIDEFAPLKESPNTVSISVIELVVGEVKVVGNSRTRARVMKRLIKTRPGEPYSIKKWEADLRRIYGTQWFESVKSSEDDRRDLGKVDLTAEVKEARTGTLGLGLVMDPRTSIAGSFNVSDANFKGTGQSVGVNYLQGTTGGGASVDLNYGNPFMDARDTSMNLSLYSHVVYRFAGTAFGGSSNPSGSNRYTERRTGGTVGFVRPIHDLFYPSWS
ncbi:MAG: hypothetical protein HY248_06385, partial [Fimbriimonas ginsengisoli]|nr:hypothetical protein [Fimbriimonas ginsengisoli]